jgi:hypothetical protein
MTPQEQELVDELFDRLARLENSPSDPEAERLIGGGLRRAPHAVYALVQTALIQDEALKRANARIEELQAQLGGGEQVQQQGSFLDGMREAVLGKRESRGSVPTVRTPATKFADGSAALWFSTRLSAANANWPSLWLERIVSRHRRIDGSGCDRRWAPAQQHPIDVW